MKTLALISTNNLLTEALFNLLTPQFSVSKIPNIPTDIYFDWAILDNPTQSDIEKIHHVAKYILCLSQKSTTYPPYVRSLKKPFKYNALLEILMEKNVFKFCINDLIFFPSLRTLQNKDGVSTALTEKESEILYVLCLQDSAISREALLKKIWNYQPSITTHTLETHIYRLRKKIQDHDSTILQTNDKGYILINS